MDTDTQNHEDDIGAAAANLVSLRLSQVGRNFLTAEDHRVMRTLTSIVMMIRDVPSSEHLGRSQTLPAYPRTNAFKSIENAVAQALGLVEPKVSEPTDPIPVLEPPEAPHAPADNTLTIEEMAARLAPRTT